MTEVKQAKSTIERDAELHSKFVRAYFEDTSILEDIPNGSALILLPDDDPELVEANLQHAIYSARQGHDVYIRHFPRPEKA